MDLKGNNRIDEGVTNLSLFDLLIMVLSVYILASLLVDAFVKVSESTRELLSIIDNAICYIFLVDFFIRLYRSPNKLQFMKWGWIDLISSIPSFDFLRYGRFVRLFRLLRILRALRSVKVLSQQILKKRSESSFMGISSMALLMVIFGSISILQVETSPASNIKTAEDAIWWSFTTITTVGYGDLYPVTTEGRVIAAFLMITGVGVFATFTGFVASWFVGGRNAAGSAAQNSNGREVSALPEKAKNERHEGAF